MCVTFEPSCQLDGRCKSAEALIPPSALCQQASSAGRRPTGCSWRDEHTDAAASISKAPLSTKLKIAIGRSRYPRAFNRTAVPSSRKVTANTIRIEIEGEFHIRGHVRIVVDVRNMGCAS